MQALYLEIKNLIINTLNLDELSVDDIETEAALFGDGLGLDSIDALELGLAVKNQYGVALSAESEEMRQHFSPLPRWHLSFTRNVPEETPL
jgi:acyl carrier protein